MRLFYLAWPPQRISQTVSGESSVPSISEAPIRFFHRGLKCLLVVDLKIGRFSHADAGQMHMYLNYAREHWTKPDENPPVGLVLCTSKGHNEAHYALEGLPNKVMAAEYQTVLPDAKLLEAELDKTRRELEARRAGRGDGEGAGR